MVKKLLSGWGQYPKVQSKIQRFDTLSQPLDFRKENTSNDSTIARGNGKSYGDSALAESVISMASHNHFLDFDQEKGEIHVQSGVLLSDILEVIIPKGWFLKVVPGTKYITVGGAIASDVHGKNHHIEGCFSNSVIEFNLMNAEGKTICCNPQDTPEWFFASCGGQGLTGIILDAKLSLKRIKSTKISQTTIRTNNLKQTFEAFEKNQNATYSVAWIDCLAQPENLGRSVIMTGDFSSENSTKLKYTNSQKLSIPFNFPSFLLNKWSVKLFNWLYYSKASKEEKTQNVSLDAFFFPLDSIKNWNRIYGSKGFVQYQFILPKEQSFEGLSQILQLISEAGQGSFLAVLKLYGAENQNYLSFPLEGYSLALDFKANKKTLSLLDQLDEIVRQFQGRIYLTKDARMNQKTFEQGYPKLDKFKQFRQKNNMDKVFQSHQSRRLGL